MRDLIAETRELLVTLDERKARNQDRGTPFMPVGKKKVAPGAKTKPSSEPANHVAAKAKPGPSGKKGLRDPAEIGDERDWANGRFKKTKDGWIRVPKKGDAKGGGDEKPTAKGAAEKPEASKKSTATVVADKGGDEKKGGDGKKKPETTAAAKDAKGGDAKGDKKKKGKKPESIFGDDEEPEDEEKTAKQKEKRAKVTAKLKKEEPAVVKAFDNAWKAACATYNNPGTVERLTNDFGAKLKKEAGETGKMMRTALKVCLPGVHTSPEERKQFAHQFLDIAKGVALGAMMMTPVGVLGIGLVAMGFRLDKVFDQLLDKPLRHATEKVFGEEYGILPSSFYSPLEDPEDAQRALDKDKESKAARGAKGEEKPKGKKLKAKKPAGPKHEWAHEEDGDIDPEEGEEEESDDIDMDHLQDAAKQQGTEMLTKAFQAVLGELAKMKPDPDDLVDALMDAGMKEDQIDGLLKYAKMAKGSAAVSEAVSDLRKLSFLRG